MQSGKTTIVLTRQNSAAASAYQLTIHDDASGALVVEVTMTAEELARVLTAANTSGIPTKWYGVGLIGKKREVKVEHVRVPAGQKARDAVAVFEVDGWTGRVSDATNHHRLRGANTFEVTYTRFVDSDPA